MDRVPNRFLIISFVLGLLAPFLSLEIILLALTRWSEYPSFRYISGIITAILSPGVLVYFSYTHFFRRTDFGTIVSLSFLANAILYTFIGSIFRAGLYKNRRLLALALLMLIGLAIWGVFCVKI